MGIYSDAFVLGVAENGGAPLENALLEILKSAPEAAAIVVVVVIFLRAMQRRDADFLGKFGELSMSMKEMHAATRDSLRE